MILQEIDNYVIALYEAHPLQAQVDLWPLVPTRFDSEQEKQNRRTIINKLKALNDNANGHEKSKNKIPIFLLIALLMNYSQAVLVDYLFGDINNEEDTTLTLIKYLQTRAQQLSKNNFSLEFGYTFWHYLAIGGHEQVIATGINTGLLNPLTQRTRSGQTVWNILATFGHTGLFFKSLKQGSLHIDDTIDGNGENAFFNLATGGNLADLFDAIDLGLFDPLTMTSANGDTIIHYILCVAASKAEIPPELIDFCEDHPVMQNLLIAVSSEYGLNNLYITIRLKQYMSDTLKLEQLTRETDKPKPKEGYGPGAIVVYEAPSYKHKSLVFRN